MFLATLFGAVVGLSLGLTGGGGSIFAVPLLVYGLGFGFRESVAVSLLVVGAVAAFGAVVHGRRQEVLWGAGLVLGLGGLTSAPLGAWLGSHLSDDVALLLFAGVMFIVGYPMLRGQGIGDQLDLGYIRCPRTESGQLVFSIRCAGKLIAGGFVVGILSGLFGVGGGFLIVPALTAVLPIAFETALASSRVSIVMIAISGVVAHTHDLPVAEWVVIGWFFTGGILGMIVGIRIKKGLKTVELRRIFGGITLGAACLVVMLSLAW